MTATIVQNGIYKIVSGSAADVLAGLVALSNPKVEAMAIDSTDKIFILTQA